MGDGSRAFGDSGLSLRWTHKLSLTARILAINIFVVALFTGGLFYLGSYRDRLIDNRLELMASHARALSEVLDETSPDRRDALIDGWADVTRTRIRLHETGPDGRPKKGLGLADSDSTGTAAYRLVDPDKEPIRKDIARAMDRAVEWATGEPERTVLSAVVEGETGSYYIANRQALPGAFLDADGASRAVDLAPDRTPYLSVVVPPINDQPYIIVTQNARDITRKVRAERLVLGLLFTATLIVSILLSLFLARTIIRPLRHLMTAAVRVRWGRERDVTVPRLPGRDDEIGMLARALSDMTQSLRERIDAGDHFAADVAHELKNPISSLRSSIEALEKVGGPELRAELIAIARDDCRRLDRLVTDIAEASRMDAELSRAHFERVDIGSMIDAMVSARQARLKDGQPRIAFARPRKGSTDVMGDDNRLERAFGNLLDNAASFSPPDGLIRVSATRSGDDVIVRVEDDGPGVAPEHRDDIFRRFYSLRPSGETFGKHSGLGLAIVHAIVTGHQGSVGVDEREDGERGASFIIRLPAASPATE